MHEAAEIRHTYTASNTAITDRATAANNIAYSVGYGYFSNLTEFGTNTQNTCTVLATAMLLGYYDYAINDKFVPIQYESGTGTNEAFHQLLNRYVYGGAAVGGIYIREICLGIYNCICGMVL